MLKWYLRGIQGNGWWLSQLNDLTPTVGAQPLTDWTAGSISPSWRGANGAQPDITFTTTQVLQVLTICATDVILADLSAGNIDLYYQLADDLGARVPIGTASHMRIRAAASMLCWSKISAQQGQPATITCRLVPLFNGSVAPLVPAGSVAIPALSVVAEQFTLGPVAFNGGSADGSLQGWDFDLSPTVTVTAAAGEDYPRSATVDRIDPVLTTQTLDLSAWTTAYQGLALTAAVWYLRRRVPNSILNYAANVAQHLKFAAVDNPCGMLSVDNTAGGHPQAATQRLRAALSVSSASTLLPFTVASSQTIT